MRQLATTTHGSAVRAMRAAFTSASRATGSRAPRSTFRGFAEQAPTAELDNVDGVGQMPSTDARPLTWNFAAIPVYPPSDPRPAQPPRPAIPRATGLAGTLQRQCACGGSSVGTLGCKECQKEAAEHAGIQPKLRVSQPGDPLERQADMVARQVMSGLDLGPGSIAPTGGASHIMRQTPEEAAKPADQDQDKHGYLVAARLSGPTPAEYASGPASAHFATRLSSAEQAGSPLAPSVRARLEPKFGRDFGAVRVHTDAAAGAMVSDIGAEAFTHGPHIFFAHGRYAPTSEAGMGLLAHELVHVVQQGSASGDTLLRQACGHDGSPTKCGASAGIFKLSGVSRNFTEIPVSSHDRSNQPQARIARTAPPLLGAMQPKLTVGQVNDALEQEADHIADQVLRMPGSDLSIRTAPPQLSRKCRACEEEEKREKLQTKRIDASDLAGREAPPIVHEVLRQPGQPLDIRTRTFMEWRFDHDFSRVRIHDGRSAGQASLALLSRAFTVGSHVVFAPGQYRPDTTDGRHLLAHELAHTLQQRSPGFSALPIQRTTYKNCTDQQLTDMVKPARDQALDDLKEAITALGTRPLSNTTAGALFLAFRNQDDATADKVKSILEKIRAGLDNSIQCDQPGDIGPVASAVIPEAFQCVRGRLGYTTPLFNMHICMNSWPNVDAVLRSQNLIHEGTHAFGHLVGDPGYFDYYTCAETASTEKLTSQRLDTPDSYSCFVHYLRHDTGILARAQSYKGASLTMTQAPGGPIDLNSTAEKTPMFSMTGVPPHSGFQFRWVIADAADKRYLMRADTGDPFEFGNHTSTFIGVPTRTLLKQGRISSARVICRVVIPAIGERLFELPVQFTGL